MKYTQDDYIIIAKNMRLFGGSFIKAIGEALSRADHENQRILANAFPKEFEKYVNYPLAKA